MRAIDADALRRDIYESVDEMKKRRIRVDALWLWGKLNDAIENTPTIEPERKKSRWVNVNNPNIGICASCLARGRAWMNFCPNCGSKMEGGAEWN